MCEGERLEGALQWERIGSATRWGAYLSAREKTMIEKASCVAGPPGRALDIGCEGGRWARLLIDRGWAVTCTDIDEESLAICAERLPETTCIAVSPERQDLPVPTASVQLVACIEVHPVTMSTWFAPEMARVLEPGGAFVTVAWNRTSARGWVADRLERARARRPHPFYGHDYRSWRREIKAHGFDLVEEKGMAWFPFKRSSNSPAVPVAAALENGLGLSRIPALSPWVVVIARRRP